MLPQAGVVPVVITNAGCSRLSFSMASMRSASPAPSNSTQAQLAARKFSVLARPFFGIGPLRKLAPT